MIKIQWRPIATFILDLLKMVVISLIIIIPIRYFLIQPFFVQGASMEPNFDNGQYLVIDELSYRLRSPERGEVIVFKYQTGDYFIKRVIGLPGETIEIKNQHIYIINSQYPQGAQLEEPYLDPALVTSAYGKSEWKLGPDQYFVMGDNRTVSYDSRWFGPIQRSAIVGRVWVRAYPFTSADVFSVPPSPAPTLVPEH